MSRTSLLSGPAKCSLEAHERAERRVIMARIFTNRKSGFIQRSGQMRRETLWISIVRAETTLAASATAAITRNLNAAALALRPFTIVRTRGRLLVMSDQVAASESYVGSIGYSVVSDQAIAVGVTAVPTPATDLASDKFFVLESWPGRAILNGTSWFMDATPQVFDSKAMRKVEEGSDIAFVSEAGIGGNGALVVDVGRLLVKLH